MPILHQELCKRTQEIRVKMRPGGLKEVSRLGQKAEIHKWGECRLKCRYLSEVRVREGLGEHWGEGILRLQK